MRFSKGLVTSQNVGSLLLFFDHAGLPKRKKILRFWTESSQKSNVNFDFWWEKSYRVQDVFRQKTRYMFDSKPDTI